MSDFFEKLQYWLQFNIGFFVECPMVGIAVAVVVVLLIRFVYRAGAESEKQDSGGSS